MEESLTVPTATTVRAVPAKLLIENRAAISKYLASTRGGEVSFTHIIGYAVIRAVAAMPSDERDLRCGREGQARCNPQRT